MALNIYYALTDGPPTGESKYKLYTNIEPMFDWLKIGDTRISIDQYGATVIRHTNRCHYTFDEIPDNVLNMLADKYLITVELPVFGLSQSLVKPSDVSHCVKINVIDFARDYYATNIPA